jgi:hypothetical protein
MKYASKWMVVPFRKNFDQQKLAPKDKISSIIKNKNLNKTDKMRLINQILQKENEENNVSQENDNEFETNFQFESEIQPKKAQNFEPFKPKKIIYKPKRLNKIAISKLVKPKSSITTISQS